MSSGAPTNSSTPTEDPFAVLGVMPDADDRALRRAYRAAALQFHPDKNPSPEAAAEFRRISEAYDTLTNPVLRRRFDEQRRAAAAPPPPPQPMPMSPFPQYPFAHDPFAQQQQPFMPPSADPFAAFFRQHQAMHENAMRAAQNNMFQTQQQQQQQQQMHGMVNPMFQFPQPAFACPPNTRRTSSSVSTRIHTEADGTVVRVTEHVNTCDGVRNVVVETLRQHRNGQITRQVSNGSSSGNPIDLTGNQNQSQR
jgi:DnaJ-class molecular chaperone